MPFWSYILTALASYLLGSIPTGFLVAKAKGIDIRAVGSGNIGATNAMRALGKPAGMSVLLIDAAKGYLACYIAGRLTEHFEIASHPFTNDEIQAALNQISNNVVSAGVFAVLGHNYTCWLKFKGGKGIATTAGVYLALAPAALGIAFGIFILTVLLTRYVSVGAIMAAIALPVLVWAMTPDNLFLGIVTTALCALAIYKHKSNIQRLLAGTENRLGNKKDKI